MKKALTFKIAAISAILLTIFTIPLVGVKGEPSTTVSGRWYPDIDSIIISNVKYAGANVFMDVFTTGGFVPGGPITGTFSQTLHETLHYGDVKLVATLSSIPMTEWPEARTFSFTQFVRDCTGTVLGRSGTFVMLIEWKGHGIPVVQGLGAYDIEGKWVIVHGTGNLAGLHGRGTCWHTRTGFPAFEYEGQVHFDP